MTIFSSSPIRFRVMGNTLRDIEETARKQLVEYLEGSPQLKIEDYTIHLQTFSDLIDLTSLDGTRKCRQRWYADITATHEETQ